MSFVDTMRKYQDIENRMKKHGFYIVTRYGSRTYNVLVHKDSINGNEVGSAEDPMHVESFLDGYEFALRQMKEKA